MTSNQEVYIAVPLQESQQLIVTDDVENGLVEIDDRQPGCFDEPTWVMKWW